MKNLVILLFTIVLSFSVTADEITQENLNGAWLIKSMNGEADGETDYWEFQEGKFTQNLGGRRMAADPYAIKDNIIDLGYGEISVLEFTNKNMKANMGGFVYALEKKSSEVIIAPAPAKILSKEEKEIADGLVKTMLDNVEDSGELNCVMAVENGKLSIDAMKAVGEKNYNDGYLEKSKFDSSVGKLEVLKDSLTLENCNKSTGNNKSFYTCLTNKNNNIAQCGKKYSYNGEPQLSN